MTGQIYPQNTPRNASYFPDPSRRSSTSHSILQALEEDSRDMTEHRRQQSMPESTSRPEFVLSPNSNDAPSFIDSDSVSSLGHVPSTPPTPGKLSRSGSFSDLDETPLERLSVFDLLENLALPQRLERFQSSIAQQASRSQSRFKSSSQNAKEKVIEEWRRRVPTADEQLDRYKRRMRNSVDRLSKLFNDSKSVTLWEKTSFIAGVLNIFISGYLVGAHPEWFPYWYTVQLSYFMPVRMYTYKKKGYHYFLADLCYFVNFLVLLSIFVFPRSKRLLISTYCLAYGNNAIAIAMWRNSLVFHSMDKIVSLFIHIMPCVTLHCLVHLIKPEFQAKRYPAIYTVLHSQPSSKEHYTVSQMMFWASWPYAFWQVCYHLLITVRRREKIRAGRPTSFTWLRRTFANNPIGKIVLSLPEPLQEPVYMVIQYVYALLTMLPCPLWFWSRWASGVFLSTVFAWSVWNGATYYIDVFGTRFQKELEALKKDVAKWQSVAERKAMGGSGSPLLSPESEIKTPGLEIATPRPAKDKDGISQLSALVEDEPDAGNKIPGLTGGLTGEEDSSKEDKKDR